jgi:hypothetical protein
VGSGAEKGALEEGFLQELWFPPASNIPPFQSSYSKLLLKGRKAVDASGTSKKIGRLFQIRGASGKKLGSIGLLFKSLILQEMLKHNIEPEDSLTFRRFMCFELIHSNRTCVSQPET